MDRQATPPRLTAVTPMHEQLTPENTPAPMRPDLRTLNLRLMISVTSFGIE